MFGDEVNHLAADVLDGCRARKLMLVTAESCTGGLIAGALTAVPGSSDVVDRGYVTYSYEAKAEMLRVPRNLIVYPGRGAVSEDVARAMVEGALSLNPGRLAVAVTGVAGPGSDSQKKPAGLVHMAAGCGDHMLHRVESYGDIGREAVRLATVRDALDLVRTLLDAHDEKHRQATS